jgi:hypothetical protein
MNTIRAVACIIAGSLLGASSACVMTPSSDGSRTQEQGSYGSPAQLNNLRDAGRWQDAGDQIERERTSLESEDRSPTLLPALPFPKADMLWYAIYLPQHGRKTSHRVWA